MYCIKCGTKLSENANFCANCGQKVDRKELPVEVNYEDDHYEEVEEIEQENIDTTAPGQTVADKLKEKVLPLLSIAWAETKKLTKLLYRKAKAALCAFWSMLSTFGKVMTVSIFLCVILCLVAFICKKPGSLVFGIIQIVLFAVAWLMHNGKIPEKKRNLHLILIVIAFVLMIPHPAFYRSQKNKSSANASTTVQAEATVAPTEKTSVIPTEPPTVEPTEATTEPPTEASTEAATEETTEPPTEEPTEPTTVETTQPNEELIWPRNQLAKLIPVPSSPYGSVEQSSEDELSIWVDQVTKDDFNAYVTACVEKGFSNVKRESSYEYEATNQEGYQLILYHSNTDGMRITVKQPLYTVELTLSGIPNLFFNKYDVTASLDGEEITSVVHGGDSTVTLELEKGSHTLELIKHGWLSPKGSVKFEIKADTVITYQFNCGEDVITLKQTEFIDLRPLTDNEARVPAAASELKYDNYQDVIDSLTEAGFTNIKTAILYDIVFGWTSEGEVDSVSIAGDSAFTTGAIFKKNAEVVVTYHMWEDDDPSRIKMTKNATDYEGKNYLEVQKAIKDLGLTNIVLEATETSDASHKDGEVHRITIDSDHFSAGEGFLPTDKVVIKYYAVVEIETTVSAKEIAEELQAKIDNQQGVPAKNVLAVFEGTDCFIECYVQDEEITNFDPEGYLFESGTVSSDGSMAHLNFTTQELIDAKASLETFLPQEMAARVAVVAMTNAQAPDVFYGDGFTYNTSRFHKYNDLSGFYLSVVYDGRWTVKDEKTWHLAGMECMMSGYATRLQASMDITFDGKNYIVSNVDKTIAMKEYLYSTDPSKVNEEHLEPAKSNPFLTVSPNLVKDDRDSSKERNQNNKTMPTATRTNWIENQFSIWNGEHTKLKGLIKDQLNNEKSYDHINTTRIDITSTEMVESVNKTLKSAGYSQKVELGDLLIMCEFSAKNAFNATVKSMAYGIAHYDENTIELVGIE